MERLLFMKKNYLNIIYFFFFGVFVLFCCYLQAHRQKLPIYIPLKVLAAKVFSGFSTKSEQIVIQQSHIINHLLTSFVWSVWESIGFGFYCTDLAPSSLRLSLYKKPQAICSHTDILHWHIAYIIALTYQEKCMPYLKLCNLLNFKNFQKSPIHPQ